MQQNLVRAMLLAISLLLLAAVPVAAQSEEEGWFLASEDDTVLVGIRQDVSVGTTSESDFVLVTEASALIQGSVETLVAADSEVVITGPSANVERVFSATGTLTVADGATVGDVYYSETVLDIDEATVTVTGEVTDAREGIVGVVAAIAAVLIVLLIFIAIGGFIAALFMTLLVIAWGTAQTRRAAATISNDVLKTIVVGLLMLVVPGIVFGLLFVTIVGIPLAILLLIVWGVVLFLVQVVVAAWIGERILPRARTAERPYGAAFLGMLILLLLSWTGVVPMLAGIFGTGAVTLAGWRVLRSGGTPPVPPGYGEPYGQPMQVAPPPYAPPPYAPPAPPQQGGWPPQGGQPPASWPQG